jgi:exocyst complex component 4
MDHLLISKARSLHSPTAFGIKKIQRNLLALQQSLKMITTDHQNNELSHSKRYYSLYFLPPQVTLLRTSTVHCLRFLAGNA